MKKAIIAVLFLLFLFGAGTGPQFAPIPAFAQSEHPETAAPSKDRCDSPPGEGIVWDLLVTRPLGFGALLFGSTVAFVAMPIAWSTHSTDRVIQSLIIQPYQYTFIRPLGTFSYDPCNPATGGSTPAMVPAIPPAVEPQVMPSSASGPSAPPY
jgi:hypothetical protein